MIRRILMRWRTNRPLDGEPQAGAIPYVIKDDIVVFLVVTSRRTGRWVFPKGGLMPGLTAAQSAAQEALEEAGVEGETSDTPIGVYRDQKLRVGRSTPISVTMYPMRVTRQLDDWPEKSQRRRHWATMPELRRLLTTPSLLKLAEATQAGALASERGDPGQAAIEQSGE